MTERLWILLAGLSGAAAVTADAAAVAADATATTADATAVTADTAAATADAAAVTACDTATAANEAADAADSTANTANNAATHLNALALAADVAFLAGVTSIQTTQASLQTQTLGIADQLGAGIRSLDLRGALVNDTINLNAGQDFTGVTLQGALNDMTSFLQAHPSETVIVDLSANEAAPINSPNGFNADLNTLLNSADTAVPGTTYRDFIYSSSNPTATPTLGQVRGKIVIIPDQSWTPPADPATGLTIGWQPSQVVQDSHSVSDPNTRWNYAENDNGSNDNGLIPTDLGNPSTLYRNNLTQDGTSTETSAALAASVNAIAEQYFGKVAVSRTTGIVGMNNPGQNLVDEIINENNLPIVVTTNSDATGATGTTLRAAITQANSQSGVSTITFADVLTGTPGNTIVLQSDLPVVTNDLIIAGPVFINTNGRQGLQAAATHNVTETNYVASDSGVTPSAPATDSTPVYLINGLLQVAPGPLAVDPVDITYGTALDNSQLHGIATDTNGASIPGTFTYTSDAGTVLNAGDGQSIAVTFTPTDTTLKPSAGTVIVNVARATPTISKLGTVNITYGAALDSSQLTGTASVPGTFVYARAAGTLLHAGNGQSESITFLPTDTADYTSVSSSVLVNVAQATPEVTVNPVSITYGTALDNSQLSGTATFTVDGKSVTVPGTFTYTSADGTLLYGGSNQSDAVTFTPGDTTDYTTISSGLNVIVNVSTNATPIVAINPVSITYGTALDNSQLSGTAIFALPGKIAVVPGTFTYTSAAGTVPNAGDGQKEDVTFTPNDTTTYASVSSSVLVNVAQGTPEVTVAPVGITYGTALDNSQLSGTATFTVDGKSVTVPGTFTYSSAAGSLLNADTGGQSEAVTFTPTDTTDYTTASGTVIVNVAQATPTLTVNPVTLIYGTALNDSQLSGRATFTVGGNPVAIPGAFTFTAPGTDGTLLGIGNNQSEAVTFTPDDSTDYTTASSSVTINILPIPPKVTITDAGGIYTGLPFAATGTATGLNGVNIATPSNPTFSYYLASTYDPSHPNTAQRLAGAPSDVGNYIAVAAFQPTGNYGSGGAITSFSITPAATATTITTSVNPAVYGQQITYTAAVTNTSGTVAAPAGAVQFVVDGVDVGSPVPLNPIGLNADGQAVSQAVSATISFPNGSGHSVQAVYVPSIPNAPDFPNPDFVPSDSAPLNQAVQLIAVEGTALFIGSDGSLSADQVTINPIGGSKTGSTGVQLRSRLNGVNTVTDYSQVFSSVHIYEQNGNDNIRLGDNLILGAIVSAGNGNDTVFLGNGDNTVTVGTGNDVIRAGNGTNTIMAGAAGSRGNDNIILGNGDNNVVTLLGDGNDNVTVGDGNGDIVSITGDGNDNVTVGDGSGDSVTIVGNGNNNVQTGTGSGTVRIAGIGHNKIRPGGTGWTVV